MQSSPPDVDPNRDPGRGDVATTRNAVAVSSRRRTGPGRNRRRGVSRRIITTTLVVVLLASIGAGIDLAAALAQPSQDSVAARTAEWARSRGMGGLVNLLELAAYDLNPPASGGEPAGGIPVEARHAATATGLGTACSMPRLASPAGTPLANEGVWQPIEKTGAGDAIVATFVRPDSQHTRYLAGVTCIRQDLAAFTLHPGTQVPGGSGWAQPPTIAGVGAGRLLATFNSGFLMADSHGGFWMDGKASGQLVKGQASMVFTSDGRLDVRSWEGGTPGVGISAVRQNLVLLVDNSQITPAVQQADSGAFGKTLGDTTFVWRSGIGIRADGSIVTVHGNALSVKTLAQLLQQAGAVRAMQLDINRDWTSYIYYRHAGSSLHPKKLTSDQVRPAQRYLQQSTRDFVAVTRR